MLKVSFPQPETHQDALRYALNVLDGCPHCQTAREKLTRQIIKLERQKRVIA